MPQFCCNTSVSTSWWNFSGWHHASQCSKSLAAPKCRVWGAIVGRVPKNWGILKPMLWQKAPYLLVEEFWLEKKDDALWPCVQEAARREGGNEVTGWYT